MLWLAEFHHRSLISKQMCFQVKCNMFFFQHIHASTVLVSMWFLHVGNKCEKPESTYCLYSVFVGMKDHQYASNVARTASEPKPLAAPLGGPRPSIFPILTINIHAATGQMCRGEKVGEV